ncbi:hypothetical protein E0H26_05520 [Micromonospora zingiberis]|uniref:Uncharacterized protein n=1 Tax=Micromonospora zingiberis TaxID=2053011 RepID=A0A4R0GMX3_9ACTN|nr:hypothetical protein [Micromonospora zingiberis]TCB98880.1 hypothetical protein E0H26_05520 [Micromonospora zingiberis]
MKLRQFGFIAVLLVAASASGSGPMSPESIAVPEPVASVTVVDLDGLADVDFGDTEAELTRRGILRTDVDACGPTLAGHDMVSPIFIEERLVLLWAGDPARTPEGITAGTPIAEVQASYPSVRELHAPQGTHRFDGLLARDGDRGYLFLHDGHTVHKIIAGYASWAQRLFVEGHGPC